MDCTQIRKRLSDPIAFHAPDVLAHIRECADCRLVYEAETVLRDSLSAERTRVPATDYGTAAQWIDRVTGKERKIMPSFITSPLGTPARKWGLGIVVAVLVFLVLVPFPYERTVGTKLTITSPDQAMTQIDVDALKARLAERGMGDVNVVRTTEPSTHSLIYYVRGTQADAKAAFEATRDLVPAVASQGEVDLAAWTVNESGSLLAQIGARTYEFSVNTAGLSDAEIQEEIRRQLETQGMNVNNVWLSRDDTSSTLNMTMTPPGEGEHQATVTLKAHEIGDGPGQLSMQGAVFIPDVDKSLPIEQQVEQIKQQLAAKGIHDVNVTVENGAIKVEAKKEEKIER
jgi:hypothetical protein